jgi:hypothetical protein
LQTLFFHHRAYALYFAFMYHEMQIYESTQLYQLLHPLCTWSFPSKVKMLEWLHSKSFLNSCNLS